MKKVVVRPGNPMVNGTPVVIVSVISNQDSATLIPPPKSMIVGVLTTMGI